LSQADEHVFEGDGRGGDWAVAQRFHALLFPGYSFHLVGVAAVRDLPVKPPGAGDKENSAHQEKTSV
jgi:hypothetical protein